MEGEGSGQRNHSDGNNVSIKIKTLDGRTFSFAVPADISVSALKEKIAGDVNLRPELQRLISRGKVLKDDQLLSAYNLEDGHQLYLVTRLSAAPSAEQGQASTTGEPATPSTPHEGMANVDGVTVRGMTVPVNGNGLPDLNRIVSTVLSSMNLPGIVAPAEAGGGGEAHVANGNQMDMADVLNATNVEVRIDSVYGMPPGFGPMAGLPPGLFGGNAPPGQWQARPPPPPEAGGDSLTVMRQYIERLETAIRNLPPDSTAGAAAAPPGSTQGEAAAVESSEVPAMPPLSSGPGTVAAVADEAATSSARAATSAPVAPSETATSAGPAQADALPAGGQARSQESGPGQGQATPAEVAAVARQVEALIRGPIAIALGSYARDLEDQANITDPAARGRLQRRILQGGSHLQQLGSLLQELGRAFVAVRYGVSPAEAHARLNVPVFINQFGPNPVIVQGVQPRPPLAVPPVWPGPAAAAAGQRQPPPPPTAPQTTGTEAQHQGAQGPLRPPGPAAAAPRGRGPFNVRTMVASMDDAGNLHIMADGVPVGLAAGGMAPGERTTLGTPAAAESGAPAAQGAQTRGPAGTASNEATGNPPVNGTPGQTSAGQAPAQPPQFPTPTLTQLHVQSWGAPTQPGGQALRFTFPISGGVAMQQGQAQGQGQGQSQGQGQGQGLTLGQAPAGQPPATGGGADLWSILAQGMQAFGGLQQPQGGAQPGGANIPRQAQSRTPSGQPDAGHLLAPLIRQLAGALSGAPQPTPPPRPEAPPAAPPAPAVPTPMAAAPRSAVVDGQQATNSGPPQQPPTSSTEQQHQTPASEQPEETAASGMASETARGIGTGSSSGSQGVSEATPSANAPNVGTLPVIQGSQTSETGMVAPSEGGSEARSPTGSGPDKPSPEEAGGSADRIKSEQGPQDSQQTRPAQPESAGEPAASSGGPEAPTAPLGLGMGGLQPLPRLRRRTSQRQTQRPSSQEGGVSEGTTAPTRVSSQGASRPPEGLVSMQQMLAQLSGSQPGQEGLPGSSGGGAGGLNLQQLFQMGPRGGAGSQPGSVGPVSLDRLIGQLSQGMQAAQSSSGAGAGGGDPLAGMLAALGGGGGPGASGGGLPPGLAGMMGQMMQSPVMQNMTQQLMGRMESQPGGGPGPGGLGGLDLGSMMAEMMPVVSQMLGGMGRGGGGAGSGGLGATQPRQAAQSDDEWRQLLSEEEAASWAAQIEADEQQQAGMEPQRPLSDAYLRGSPGKRQRTAMEGAAQRLQRQAPPQEVLRSVAQAAAENASSGNGAATRQPGEAEEVARHIAATPGLAEAYLSVLWHDLAGRLTADTDATDPARFPNARAFFLSAENAEPDGGDR